MFINEEGEDEFLYISQTSEYMIRIKPVQQKSGEFLYHIHFELFSTRSTIRMGVYKEEKEAARAIRCFMESMRLGEQTFTFKKES